MACEILLKGSFEILKSNFLFLVCLSITVLKACGSRSHLLSATTKYWQIFSFLVNWFTVSNNEVLADFQVFSWLIYCQQQRGISRVFVLLLDWLIASGNLEVDVHGMSGEKDNWSRADKLNNWSSSAMTCSAISPMRRTKSSRPNREMCLISKFFFKFFIGWWWWFKMVLLTSPYGTTSFFYSLGVQVTSGIQIQNDFANLVLLLIRELSSINHIFT